MNTELVAGLKLLELDQTVVIHLISGQSIRGEVSEWNWDNEVFRLHVRNSGTLNVPLSNISAFTAYYE
jgi:hypothetical protein